MSILLGDIAPNFQNFVTTEGEIADFHNWIDDSWCILFSHPKDFTPVCTTELGYMSKIMPEFTKRKVKVIALSVDTVDEHHEWIKDINETQNTTVNFPIIADENHRIADLYNMIHPKELDKLTVRCVFVIDPSKKVRLMLTYPASTGRNFDELLRVVDSLQLTSYQKVATPVNWRDGDDCIIVPSLTDQEATELYGEFKTVKPYLRTLKQPARYPAGDRDSHDRFKG